MKAKALLALGAAWSLSACNMVVSDKPWFDAPSGAQLRDGHASTDMQLVAAPFDLGKVGLPEPLAERFQRSPFGVKPHPH